MILAIRFICIVKKVEKTCTFTQKWFEHLLPVTFYLVTVTEFDSKCARGMKEQLLKIQVLMFYPLGENSEKP